MFFGLDLILFWPLNLVLMHADFYDTPLEIILIFNFFNPDLAQLNEWTNACLDDWLNQTSKLLKHFEKKD